MFDIGIVEIFVIFVVSLLVLGPDKLPEVARTLGRAVRSIKSFINDLKEQSLDFEGEVIDLDLEDSKKSKK